MGAIVHTLGERVFLESNRIYACIYWQPDGSAIISTRACTKRKFGGHSASQVARDIIMLLNWELKQAFMMHYGLENERDNPWEICLRQLVHDITGRQSAYILVPRIAFLEPVGEDLSKLLKATIKRSLKQFKGVLFERW